MTNESYGRAKKLFLEVCSLNDVARTVALDRECGNDQALRSEVESLLRHHVTKTVIDGATIPVVPHFGAGSATWATTRHAAKLLVHRAREQKGAYLAGLLALLLLLAGGIWSHYGVERSLRNVLRDELQTVLDADCTALEIWLNEQKAEAKRWAQQPDVREQILALLSVAKGADNPRPSLLTSSELAELRESLLPYVEEEGRTGYAVVDRAGLVVASRNDEDVGVHLNSEGMADNSYALRGETRVSRPHPQGTFAEDRPVRRDEPMIYVSTPVRDTVGNIVATFNLGMRADDQFTRILSVARIGRSGETYAFDDRGWFLSDSRFNDQLKSLGLIPNEPHVRAIFNMQIRDPGVNLLKGATPELSTAAQPLTKMARLAIAGENGVDVDGYRDYRGVEVIGAWKWLTEYGFGVVTEVDYDEAYEPLSYPIIASWLPLGVLLVAVCGLLYSAFHIANLQRQIGVARQLGQYTLEEKIGEGGIGVVYRARHAMLRRPTAVKLLKPEQMTPIAVARFEREVQLASQLTHPNTIEIYDFGRTADGVFYYAMEFLPGLSLAQLIQLEGAIPPARAVHILKQICGSLAEAHTIGLVHRDIKPHNIMLCERGGHPDFVKVLDFGLVKNVDGRETLNLTAHNAVSGTPLYMPPERLRDPLLTDPRSDIYSLGAVAYNLVTGRSIFQCANDLDILFQVMNVVPDQPAGINPAVPADLDRLIVSCLAKDPADRPNSADEVLDALDQLTGMSPWTESDARRWWRERSADIGDLQRQQWAETVELGSGAAASHSATSRA